MVKGWEEATGDPNLNPCKNKIDTTTTQYTK